MSRLFRADLRRLKKSRIFWGMLLAEVLFMVMLCVSQYRSMVKWEETYTLDGVLFSVVHPPGILLAVICALFIGTGYSDGTIRNKIITGQTRGGIYFAGLFSCAAAAAAMLAVGFLTIAVLGIPMFDKMEMSGAMFACLLAESILNVLVYASLYHMIAILCDRKSYTAIICMVLAFAVLAAGVWVIARLSEPEYIQGMLMTVDGVQDAMMEPNPNYLSGTLREVFYWLLDLIPYGQCLEIAQRMVVNPVRMAAISVGWILVINFAGFWCFKNKDIR